MKLTVARDLFAAALARVAPLAPDVTTIPIVGTVRLETGPGGLTVTASDLGRWLTEQVDAEPRATWAGCVDASRLNDLVKSLRAGGDIVLEVADDAVKLMSTSVSARLWVFPADDFPPLPEPRGDEPVTRFELDALELRTVLKFCGHAVSEEEQLRWYLCGIHLGGNGIAAATDGYRLAVHRLPYLRVPDERGLIVPTPACRRLQALLRGAEGTVYVTATPRTVSVRSGQWQLVSKLIDGTFPTYSRAIPPRSNTPVVVDRAALVDATDRVKLMNRGSGKKTHGLRLSVKGNDLIVSGGEADAAIEEVITITGDSVTATVGINVIYLAEALEVLESDQIELHLSNEPHRGLWLCADGEDHDGIVVMPMLA
jgi:DNA polymerase-3 subunit beta